MMGVYVLATLLSAWLVCTGAHVIDKRQASYNNLALCRDTAVSIDANSNLYVTSPNYGYGNYQDNTRCNLVLQSGSETLFITVRYDLLELESHPECGYDSLCVGGYKFCGQNWAANKEYSFIIPANRTFTLDFKTDGSATGRGFQLFITGSLFTGQTALTPVGGFGNSYSLQEGYLTYSSNYSDTYQDKCAADSYGGNGYYATSPNYYTDYYQTSPNYYTDYYQTSPNYYTDYPWYYQTSPNYYTDYPWNYQTSPNYYTDYPWYYQTSPNYYTDYPWYYQTSSNYYTDYPYYYNTTPDRRTDSTFLLYSLYEALASLSQSNFDIQTAITHLQRAIAQVDGSVARKK